MLNEMLFNLFLVQFGTVAAITACMVGVMMLFYAEIIALDKCDTQKPIEAPSGPLGECEQGIHCLSYLRCLAGDSEWTLFKWIY